MWRAWVREPGRDPRDDSLVGEVGQAIESVAAVSEQNSASVEEVSATAEELSAQVEEVAASAQEL